jgi:tetratricopeptide (TPR) repeat protein
MLLLALGLMILFVYHATMTHDFINYDDPYLIIDNPSVRSGLSLRNIQWAFSTFHASNWMPLTWLSHMLDVQLFGLNPGRHHMTSLILHMANTLLLYLVLKAMTGALWRSFMVASLFALHPLHVEVVAWAAARRDVLSTFFWFLTMGAYYLYARKPNWKRYLPVAFSFALGLMVKPMLVTLPFVLLLLDYWPLERLALTAGEPGKRCPRVSRRNIVMEKIPLLAMTFMSSWITYAAQAKGGAVQSMESYPLLVRCVNAAAAYVQYIVKTIRPTGLAVLYPHPGAELLVWKGLGFGILLITISAMIIRQSKKFPYLPVGWLWYLGTLVPVIGIVQVGIQSLADRYTYIALTGIFIMVSWGFHDIFLRHKYRLIVSAAASGAVLISLAGLARTQVGYWENSVTLFEHAVEVTSNNFVAHNNLGNALSKSNRDQEAVEHYIESLRIKSDYDKAYNNLGIAFDKLGRTSQAIEAYNRAILINPDYAEARFNLGLAYIGSGDLKSAASQYIVLKQQNSKWAGRLHKFIQYSGRGSL